MLKRTQKRHEMSIKLHEKNMQLHADSANVTMPMLTVRSTVLQITSFASGT